MTQEIFSLLASTLPYTTHFYLSYFPLQCTFQVHCSFGQGLRATMGGETCGQVLEAARYPIAMKYLAMKVLRGELGAIPVIALQVSASLPLWHSQVRVPDDAGLWSRNGCWQAG